MARKLLPAFMQNSRTAARPGARPSSAPPSCSTGTRTSSRKQVSIRRRRLEWAEQLEFAKKLTKSDGGNVTQWGLQVPSTGFPYWLFQGFSTQAGALLMNEEGNRTFFDKPEVVEALTYWVDLSRSSTRCIPRASSSGAPRRKISSRRRSR